MSIRKWLGLDSDDEQYTIDGCKSAQKAISKYGQPRLPRRLCGTQSVQRSAMRQRSENRL